MIFDPNVECPCERCEIIEREKLSRDNPSWRISKMRFTMCPNCGNKRCPKGTDHDLTCTGSNEPGQAGSSWENYR